MRKKVIVIIIIMLFFTTLLPTTVLAGDEEHPEITDTIGDARWYLDIDKAWFYEDPITPDVLYTTIEIVKPSVLPPKQHLVVLWEMNGEHYAAMLAVGYDIGIEFPWLYYSAIEGRGQFGDPKPKISTIDGFLNKTDGTITCKIPKSTIGNPQPGDVLTNTQSQCFQRFRFWGRLGFYPFFRHMIFDQILKKWQVEDIAPNYVNDSIVYGSDYIIQY
ncbi:MAG TPA: hypothetical protein VN365_00725 [Candidatus Thermoplasmatota archaeon]|nr:hypothetical protein [Candidatus Thermoplasmatota archaeon]